MENLRHYIQSVLGENINPEPIAKVDLGSFPAYIGEGYRLSYASMLRQAFVLVEYRNEQELSISQLEKHLAMLKNAFAQKVVFLANNITSFNRKRLIEKGINFIIPGKQLYLPDFLVDLKENFSNQRATKKPEKLLPSAQFILLYHILHHRHKEKVIDLTFKELALKLGYTQMAITKAVESLKHFELCRVEGGKEKHISFTEQVNELWHIALPYLVNPVLKRMYVDEKPTMPFMLYSNASALTEYTEMNPSKQKYYAIEKTAYYSLVKSHQLKNANEQEGNYCLEVWKYDPVPLVTGLDNDMPVVDPLSLYLSLRESHDERVEGALDEMLNNNLALYGTRNR